MQSTSYPNTSRHDETPELPPGDPGIALAGPVRCRVGEPCVVYGAFRVAAGPEDSSEPERHRAIALAITARFDHWTVDPFRRALLFEDDLSSEAGAKAGTFAVDLSLERGFRYPGRYYVTASMGPHTSNTLVVEVQ